MASPNARAKSDVSLDTVVSSACWPASGVWKIAHEMGNVIGLSLTIVGYFILVVVSDCGQFIQILTQDFKRMARFM
jgi:hypothetical protein